MTPLPRDLATYPTDEPTLQLAARLLELRTRRGLTIAACAHAAGVARDSWRHWEHARTRPRAIYAARIARALNEPIAALYAPTGALVLPDITLGPATLTRLQHGGRPELEHLAHELAELLTTHLAAEIALRANDTRRPRTRPTSRASSPAVVRARIAARRADLEAPEGEP